jgi:hypothetical protein
MEYENPWIYNKNIFESEHIEDNYGFVYLIENIDTNKKYVGKKFFWSKKTKIIKGKRKKSLIESDWKEYYGSNLELQKDIAEKGIYKFRRNVLKLCKNKTQCSYFELVEQVERQVLLDKSYYNGFIGGRINGRNL